MCQQTTFISKSIYKRTHVSLKVKNISMQKIVLYHNSNPLGMSPCDTNDESITVVLLPKKYNWYSKSQNVSHWEFKILDLRNFYFSFTGITCTGIQTQLITNGQKVNSFDGTHVLLTTVSLQSQNQSGQLPNSLVDTVTVL